MMMPRRKTSPILTVFCAALAVFVTTVSAGAKEKGRVDVLVLGDSQISFSAGPPYLEFFENLTAHCAPKGRAKAAVEKLGARRTAAIGVRSTSVHSWVARKGGRKDTICAVDKKYGVNAGAFGIAGNPKRAFVQIGKGPDYQFCEANRSPLESALRAGYYDPDLMVMAVLGNGADRWANSREAAREDARALMKQVPKGVGCIFLSTAPVFSKKTNDLRALAQENFQAAFPKNGRCVYVAGFSEETRAVIEGKAKYFRRRTDGSVKDPLHPNAAAMRLFLDLNTPEICDAVRDVLN
ncbi:hypothetical protein [Shimia marina]|uniref:SGNH hydrolase-type esterase domain-containing protein n=1 Tax=Shimia marina TaxID=321267 RepID=A0A0P1ESE8_9RHOB|nr:hypothetical protein [Shimia marina]CUH53472.1 hypothetical protein SHM7688_02926 [Shimia marina]SFD76191.1 hypothetical protein SAMN04488037_102344 [Shimia marina]